MTLRAKVLSHVWSYDFYDMTLSTTATSYDKIVYVIFLFACQFRVTCIH